MKYFLKTNIHEICLFLSLFLVIFISVFEIHYLSYLFLIFFYYSKVSKKVLSIIVFLAVIMIIAIISSLFNRFLLFDWVKDFTYFSRPILAVLAGYLISKKINNFVVVFRIIILVSLIFAVFHIFKIFFYIDFNSASVSEIRRIGGISNEIEVFSIVILLTSNRVQNLELIKNKFHKKIILIIFLISFLLYLSRTMIVTFTIFYLASYGYLKITKKSVKYLVLVVSIFILFYAYLFSRDFERDKPGIESFLYKMKIAPSEIFSASKNLDTKNHANLWDHWRAYEAIMALNQMDSKLNIFIGKGFGSLVDLKFSAPLGESNLRFIPMIHNGYVNLFFKAGFLGLIFYILMLFDLYLFCYRNDENKTKKLFFNLTAALSIHFLFTTLIVTGIYNNMEPYFFILGFLLYFSLNNKSKLIL